MCLGVRTGDKPTARVKFLTYQPALVTVII
jgi:hypothetical protein